MDLNKLEARGESLEELATRLGAHLHFFGHVNGRHMKPLTLKIEKLMPDFNLLALINTGTAMLYYHDIPSSRHITCI